MNISTIKKLQITLLFVSVFCASIFAQTQAELEAAFSQSYVFESEKNYDDALQAILKVHSEKCYETQLRLGWLFYSSKKYPESCAHYKKAIALQPNSLEAKLGLANPLAAQSSWEEVTNIYNDILKTDPHQITVNYRLGLIYYNRENFVQAKKYFDVYLNLYPFDYDALSISAWNNLNLGKKDDAKNLFNKALLLYPKNADSLEGLKQCK